MENFLEIVVKIKNKINIFRARREINRTGIHISGFSSNSCSAVYQKIQTNTQTEKEKKQKKLENFKPSPIK